jgi:hypothetical protein
MGSRDHSIECEKCGACKGGMNDLKCLCETGQFEREAPLAWVGTPEQADAARALIDALIYPNRDFEHAWEQASLHWGRFGEVPARIALLEVALIEACEIAIASGRCDKDRIGTLLAMAVAKC